MKILLIGNVKFSEIILKQLIESKSNISGVCTRKESKFNSDHVNLRIISEKHDIPCLETDNVNDKKSLSWIKKNNPSVIFCFGWSKMIGDDLLKIPQLGVIGFHPAALPYNRGRHPIIWALVLGLKETASTFYFMDKSFDSGDILSQEKVPIYITDNAQMLYKRISKTATKQMIDFIPKLACGKFTKIKQDKMSANFWRKRNFCDGEIDWRMSAESIYNLVRALSKPYVGAHFNYDDDIIKVWNAKIELNVPNNIEPGKVLAVIERKVLVKTGINGLWLTQINPQIKIKPGNYL